MSAIGDELREFVKTKERYMCSASRSELLGLADRIDSEIVELPRGKDGKPIRVGETVYGEDGNAWRVRGVTINLVTDTWRDRPVHATDEFDNWSDLKPECLTHERPDSLERIADELDEWRFEHMRDLEADGLNDMSLFADRIRRLAKEREHERE